MYFTMMCYFFGSAYTISGQNDVSIFNFSILFDGKVNLYLVHWGGRGSKFKIVFKIDFGFWCNFKTNDFRYIKFSLVVYISILYTR